jgi:hypothetical protein
VVAGASPRIEVFMGNLRVNALLDSGSTRSIISQKQFQELRCANTKLQCEQTNVNCVMASGQSLEILGEIQVLPKIQRFSWRYRFLVSKKLRVT